MVAEILCGPPSPFTNSLTIKLFCSGVLNNILSIFDLHVVYAQGWKQGRRQKNFQGEGARKKTKPKNSIIKPPYAFSVSCMKIQGGGARPLLPTPMVKNR